jgi:hypothetical protein
VNDGLQSIIIQDGEVYQLGFLVEELDGYCTVFIPDAPRHDSGEVKILPSKLVKKLGVPVNKITHSLNGFGKGAISLIK